MADRTGIEWTDATWNPLSGCSLVSPGCTNCYAMGVAHRFRNVTPLYAGLTHEVNGKPVWTGKIAVNEKVLDQPLRWKAPRRIFVNSMSDLFHEAVPDATIYRLLMVMGAARQHTFQILTKRADRMQAFMAARNDILPNVWLGVSVEDQRRADERIPLLLSTPAALRFISAEPLLGPVNLGRVVRKAISDGLLLNQDGRTHPLGWVIVGGESGSGARPMHPDWARALRDECLAADIPFFFKQWGEFLVGEPTIYENNDGDPYGFPLRFADGSTFAVHSDGADIVFASAMDEEQGPRQIWRDLWGWQHQLVRKVGKTTAANRLDGAVWDEFPQVPA